MGRRDMLSGETVLSVIELGRISDSDARMPGL